MKIVAVASHNPVKIEAARLAFGRMFPEDAFVCEGVSASSGVSDQPMGDDETLRGAYNRAVHAQAERPDADFAVGVEGGVEEREEGLGAFAWAVVLSQDGAEGRGRTGMFFLPPAVADLVHGGKELGEADDIVFNRTNSKQTNGAVGILTGDVLTRTSYYADAVLLALIPFRNPELYSRRMAGQKEEGVNAQVFYG